MCLGDVKRWVLTCVLAGALLPATPAVGAVGPYMTISGVRQGPIRNEAMSEKISVTSVTHDVTMASGMAAGRRQHGLITIRREVDAASPKLMQAMNTREALNDVTIVFPSGAGAGKAAQTINLKDAVITSVRVSGRSEEITIEYQTIQVTYVNGNKSATDDWTAPN